MHVWETCRNNEGYRLMKCNCSALFPGVPDGEHSAGQCGIDITKVHQLGGRPHVASSTPSTYAPAQSTYPYAVYPPMQTYTTVPLYPVQAPLMPIYSIGTNGLPVNIRGGAVLTEARGIFIRNISYKATPDDLNRLLYTVGNPVDSHLLRDSRTGAFKGVATARFGSKDEAQHAAMQLNGREHMGMTLQVRMDTDTTVVGRTEPMVVNGSYKVRKSELVRTTIPDNVQY